MVITTVTEIPFCIILPYKTENAFGSLKIFAWFKFRVIYPDFHQAPDKW